MVTVFAPYVNIAAEKFFQYFCLQLFFAKIIAFWNQKHNKILYNNSWGEIMDFSSNIMKLNTNNGVSHLTFNALSSLEFVHHAFSTRIGGVSKGEFSTMNLSFGRGDSDENIIENYRIFCKSAGFDIKTLVASAQDHNAYIAAVTSKDVGNGIFIKQKFKSIDALITNEKGVTLVTYYADCTPVYLIDPVKKCIGLVHAGWRGTAKGIAKNAVLRMAEEYGSDPADVIAAVGPCIMDCCYEVSQECLDEFEKSGMLCTHTIAKETAGGKYMLNLPLANKQVLLSAGLHFENIHLSDVCTCCNSSLLFSHRATGGRRGGMCAMLCLS